MIEVALISGIWIMKGKRWLFAFIFILGAAGALPHFRPSMRLPESQSAALGWTLGLTCLWVFMSLLLSAVVIRGLRIIPTPARSKPLDALVTIGCVVLSLAWLVVTRKGATSTADDAAPLIWLGLMVLVMFPAIINDPRTVGEAGTLHTRRLPAERLARIRGLAQLLANCAVA